jgi:hypothetical protein|tara:strand:- start:373 stop:597 length:225 start_codon:yes stop_codon:yes gene_type:complete
MAVVKLQELNHIDNGQIKKGQSSGTGSKWRVMVAVPWCMATKPAGGPGGGRPVDDQSMAFLWGVRTKMMQAKVS